ncbi:5-formyltetrahydrofolate cyclo-ligase [Candidatus Endobugula sertula]|uniref:5-formyltetrahydrofolate cyclo-ligase n=1 Tax=Candidatus Endobugula sertula TaxID=62101 RepID=A0A1D2QR50_9GAMM|nr:5-formyltetrahydrofolate cyclo-ligase [Candidatus Endobugula sertula]
MRRRRCAVGQGAQKRASYELAMNILQTEIYRESRHIAFYLANEGEIGLGFLLKKAWSQGKTCYLPVIEKERLAFVNYTPTTPLESNKYGILEPVSGSIIAACSLDLVLTPLVAFDKYNHRIGMGGGYYDKTFERGGSKRRALMMGVAYYFQQVRKITPEPWDVPLDCVVTN